WAHAEALAFASLVVEGTPIRLTGQDTERGTFSQRHLVLHDAVNGQRHAPIQSLPGARAPFELHNSPLSEFACLGFEYGYAAAAPEALVLWEAQYGDFTNAAEVIIDQFPIPRCSTIPRARRGAPRRASCCAAARCTTTCYCRRGAPKPRTWRSAGWSCCTRSPRARSPSWSRAIPRSRRSSGCRRSRATWALRS